MMALVFVATALAVSLLLLTAVRRDLYLMSLYGHYKASGQLDDQFSMKLSFPPSWYLRLSLQFPGLFQHNHWRIDSRTSEIPRLSHVSAISGSMFHRYCNEMAKRIIDLAPFWMRYNRRTMIQDTMILLYQLKCSDGECRL